MAVPVRRHWRNRLAWAGGVVLFLLVVAAWPVYRFKAHERELRAAVAEADRLDPGWRFEELEVARAEVPDADNAALQVRAAYRLLPGRLWPPPPARGPGIDEVLDDLPANAPLDEAHVAELRAALKQANPALVAARRLADYPHGRYTVAWTSDGISTVMPHLEEIRTISRLLFLDAVLRAQDGDAEGAMRSGRAALNACRSVGDEPAIGSQLCRLSWGWPVRWLERVLAQGEPSAATLEQLQRLLEQETREPSLLVAARAERAEIYQFLEGVRARKLDRRALGLANPYGLPDQAVNWIDAARASTCEAAYLRYLTELVEMVQLPPAERAQRLEGLQRPKMALPQPLQAMMVGFDEKKGCRWLLKGQAQLQCALAALAIERYRRDHGRWPERLQDLLPAYLSTVPTDPFDGSPLRLVPTEDGVVISGLDSRVSFRLWDAKKRHRGPMVDGSSPEIKSIGLKAAQAATADPASRPPRDALSEPRARTDRNSQIAHRQLLAKAKKGRIDVYFVGDSITRRWGATDYPEFLAHWKRTFHGWNAANFGWGGDTIPNILWRLQNGELDGVNPKVIVVLAGTNNLRTAAPAGNDDDQVAGIARGIRALVDLCRQKAPDSVLILMGITPRNDRPGAMATINRINERIAGFADGKQVRYLNINDKLATADGVFREGMSRDGLHLSVKGYQVWADALRRFLTELLGPSAKEDHAPPPTGDPSKSSQ
jgi:lysophospholipase L1-like esterase